MIDPVAAFKSSILPIPLPTSTHHASHTSSPTAIPSIVPDFDEQFVGDSGKRTLWVIFIAMTIFSAAFAALSWRVPIVSLPMLHSVLCANNTSNAVSSTSSLL